MLRSPLRFPKRASVPSDARWHVGPNIHRFCSAGARVIFPVPSHCRPPKLCHSMFRVFSSCASWLWFYADLLTLRWSFGNEMMQKHRIFSVVSAFSDFVGNKVSLGFGFVSSGQLLEYDRVQLIRSDCDWLTAKAHGILALDSGPTAYSFFFPPPSLFAFEFDSM